MKKFLRKTGLFSIALISILLVAAMSANATNYFTGSSGDPTNVNIWWTNTNGTGSHPANFTTAGDVFTIQNGHTLTNNATSWVVTGSVIIQSGGILSLTAANGTHSVGALTIDAGGSAIINRQFTVNGATSISGSISFASTSTTARPMAFGGDVTLNSGAVWTEATNGSNGDNNTYSFAGNFTNNATTFTATNNAAAIHTFTGAAKTISGATATSIPFVTISGSYTNSGTLTVANTLTINGGASLSNNGTATVTTALSGTGSFTNGATGTLNIGGTSGITTLTATASGNTVNYTGAAQTIKVTAYYKLGLSGSGNKTFAAGITMSNNLSISGTAVAALGTNNFSVLTLTIGGVGQPAGTYGSTASTATFKPSAFGTTGTGILTVTQQSCTPPTINGTLSTCGGLTTQLTSPDAPAASNPWVSATTSVATISNTGLVTGVSAGTSVITFTNSTGCTNTAIVTVNATPTTSFTKNDVTCFNTNTGQIVITGSGGTAPYTYSIDNGVNYSSPVPTGTFNNLGAGSYKIRVKDSNGCQSKPVQ